MSYHENIPINTLLNELYVRVREEILSGNYKNKPQKTYHNIFDAVTEEGKRNTTLTSYAGKLKSRNTPEKEAEVILKSLNQTLCDPPLAEKEVDKVINSIYSYKNNQQANITQIIRICDQPEPSPRKWLLEYIIPLNFPTLKYGLGGIGKSYLAVDLAILASFGGQKFLDYNFYKEPTNTLYVDYELDKEELTRRAFEISRGHQLTSPPKNLFYCSPKNNISKFLKELNYIIRFEDIKFIIVDSLGASRLDSSDEIQVIERFDELKHSGVTSLVLDHHSKMQAQDNIEIKTPYGSVYKYNMARSVLHLVLDNPLENGITLRLLHKKSNFGRLQPEMLIDIIFDKDSVLICKSNSVSQEVEQMLMIQDGMAKMLNEKGYKEIQQKDLIEFFKGTLGKDKLISLLRKGRDKYWIIVKGEKGSSLVYIPLVEEFKDLISKFGNSNTIYNRNLRISEDGEESFNENLLEPPPKFL